MEAPFSAARQVALKASIRERSLASMRRVRVRTTRRAPWGQHSLDTSCATYDVSMWIGVQLPLGITLPKQQSITRHIVESQSVMCRGASSPPCRFQVRLLAQTPQVFVFTMPRGDLRRASCRQLSGSSILSTITSLDKDLLGNVVRGKETAAMHVFSPQRRKYRLCRCFGPCGDVFVLDRVGLRPRATCSPPGEASCARARSSGTIPAA